MQMMGHSIDGAKVFSANISDGATSGVALVRFNGGVNKAISDRGYRSTYNLVVLMDAGTEFAYTNRHEMAREHPVADKDGVLYDILMALEDGSLSVADIPGGRHIDRADWNKIHGEG